MSKFVNNLLLVFLAIGFISLVGCNTVKPWEKENLAKPQMALGPSSSVVEDFHTLAHHAKEASRGGYTVGGGGCGCG